MKNGNVYEFVVRTFDGQELWFMYCGKKYFLKGWRTVGRSDLYLYEMWENGETYHGKGTLERYPVDDFLKAKIWDGKPFGEAQQEMKWVDGLEWMDD